MRNVRLQNTSHLSFLEIYRNWSRSGTVNSASTALIVKKSCGQSDIDYICVLWRSSKNVPAEGVCIQLRFAQEYFIWKKIIPQPMICLLKIRLAERFTAAQENLERGGCIPNVTRLVCDSPYITGKCQPGACSPFLLKWTCFFWKCLI